MTDSSQRFGAYDPFEDTGDWPFRDAPPREDEGRDEPVPAVRSAEETPPAPLTAAEKDPVVAASEPESEAELEAPDPDDLAADVGIEELETAPEPEAAIEEVAVEAEADKAADELDLTPEHAPGDLIVPSGVDVLTGAPHGFRRSVAVVVGRFNGDVTTRLLEHALDALRECHVAADAITVVPVPGAFELPLAALALAKTRRYACVVALGCVIRGETAHFDVIAGEAASGLQLAAIETGIPVSFGVLTCDTLEQAEARVERGADAARAALEMADLFSHVRTRAAQQ